MNAKRPHLMDQIELANVDSYPQLPTYRYLYFMSLALSGADRVISTLSLDR